MIFSIIWRKSTRKYMISESKIKLLLTDFLHEDGENGHEKI